MEHVAADADVDPAGPYFPTAQSVPEQVSDEVAPAAAEYFPAGHKEQVADEVAPAAAEYLPGAHVEHVAADADLAPAGPYFPAAQRVPEQLDAPAVEYLPATHVEHVAADADVDPAGPYFPAAQSVPEQVADDVAPAAAEYLPAAQVEHIESHGAAYSPGLQQTEAPAPPTELLPAKHLAPLSALLPESHAHVQALTRTNALAFGMARYATAKEGRRTNCGEAPSLQQAGRDVFSPLI